MRKVLSFLCLYLVITGASAQLTKEHAFDDLASININVITLENSGQKTLVVNRIDSTTYQCVFYNPDYSAFKTISIDLDPLFIINEFRSPILLIQYISENVFDQDPDIDILCHLSYFNDSDEEYAQVVIFHENGGTLFESDVENSNAWLLNAAASNSQIRSSLVNTESGAKMILDVYYFNEGTYSYDVYDLPGSLPSALKNPLTGEEGQGNYLRAFPVPADEYMDMEYRLAEGQNNAEIVITDEQGKTIQKIRVENNRGMIRVPVTNYRTGLYVYKLNTRRGIPRSGKIMILRQQ